MGLGKTLQSICIMASSHHNRRTQYAATKDAAFAPFPSLVVCPPTLVGHWAFEISKFLPDKDLSTVQFVGSPAERAAMREDISDGGDCVVITSYDTLRNEIGFLGKFNWAIVEACDVNDKGEITAVINTDGSYLTRNKMVIRGVPAPPVTQTGRYRIEPVDKQRIGRFDVPMDYGGGLRVQVVDCVHELLDESQLVPEGP
jgi:TATA-binding protein-associated factor